MHWLDILQAEMRKDLGMLTIFGFSLGTFDRLRHDFISVYFGFIPLLTVCCEDDC